MLLESTLDGALLLARHGFSVVRLHYPIFREDSVLCSCGNPKCSAQGKHPVGAQWGKSATTDAEAIRGFWREADWNVGVLLGLGHGIPPEDAVIDIEDDLLEGRELADVLLKDYPTVTWSSGKSLHRIYRWHPDLPAVANMTVNGLEFRFGGAGKETQSVAPPSIHKSRRRYNWVEGRSPDQIGIATIPQHVVEWICQQYAAQAEGKTGGVPSNADYKRFRVPGKKIQEPGRNNAVVRHANSSWRDACKLFGFNRLEEQEIKDQVWLWVWGANLATCDPPLDEAEVWTAFCSSERFMRAELLREMQEKAAIEVSAVPTVDEPVDLDAKSRQFSDYLVKHGIRMSHDPMFSPIDKEADRIDEWQVPHWQLTYVTKADQDLLKLTIGDTVTTLKPAEFEKARDVARKVAAESNGRILLDRSFAWWNWKSLWDGKKNGEDNGITRGLREYLANHASVEETKQMTVVDQIAGVVESMLGAKSAIVRAYHEYCGKIAGGRASRPIGRLKLAPGGDLVTLRAPEDPHTGVYSDPQGELFVLVKFDEVSRKFRGSYGSSVTSQQMAEALEQIGFNKERIKSGALEGRWFLKKLAKSSQNDLAE